MTGLKNTEISQYTDNVYQVFVSVSCSEGKNVLLKYI